ncbi:MAG: HlyD family efflux transporter periplasmic adaptor subunit [Candidatus Kerfeldbacteria bacterium]|nr:HlyD family efflux transporter periplasmic adaptor subunit [Candidatus Kerfeldbacteria bacterium]
MTQLPTPKKKSLWKRPWLWALLAIIIIVSSVAMLAMRSFTENKKKSLSYLEQTVTVSTGDLERTISATGSVVVDAQQPLFPAIVGTVKEVKVAVGDLVAKDQVLVTLNSSEIIAPFDGRVLSLSAFDGGSVSPAAPVAVVGYRSTHVEFMASDAEVVELEKGQEAHLSIPSINGGRESYTASVHFVDVQKTTSLNSFGGQQAVSGYLVKVSADSLPEELRNRIGLVVDVEIVTDTVSQKTRVDSSAIQYTDEDKPFVYRAPELTEEFYAQAMSAAEITDILEKVEVTVGFEGDDAVEILSGLSVDEKVLLYVPKETATSPF